MIHGKPHWLWRAVDQDGYVLDEILQARWNTKAARRLLTRLLKLQGLPPGCMITDELNSYKAARRKLGLSIWHLSHRGLNNEPSSFAKTRTFHAEISLTRPDVSAFAQWSSATALSA